jgi:hypothetical protein
MAERFPQEAKNAAQAGISSVRNQAAQLSGDLPNAQEFIPQPPEIPDLESLVPKLPLPSFRKPKKIKVEKPPLPRKIQKAKQIPSKIPNIPKVEVPDVQGAVANSLNSIQEVGENATTPNIPTNLPI